MEYSKNSLKRPSSNTISSSPKIPKIEREYNNSTIINEDEHTQFYDDIKCSICSEILMRATTLNCSHTFCKYCIDRWTAKQSDCPICRSKIVYQVSTLILDNIIEKIIKNLPQHMQNHREKILSERDKKVALPKPSKTKTGWIKMRRMNGMSSYYLLPTYVNARRHLNEVTIMYFEDDPEWEDLGDDNNSQQCGSSTTTIDDSNILHQGS